MMEVVVIPSNEFKRQFKKLAKKYHSLIEDTEKLVAELKINPDLGTDLGNNVRKVRMSISSKGKGKSGGARVITYKLIPLDSDKIELSLLTIYDKNEIQNVSDDFIKTLVEQLVTKQ